MKFITSFKLKKTAARFEMSIDDIKMQISKFVALELWPKYTCSFTKKPIDRPKSVKKAIYVFSPQ